MDSLPNIHSLHGSYFTAEICFTDVVGRISHDGSNVMYLCHNNSAIRLKPNGCSNMFGYEYAWPALAFNEKLQDSIQNIKILPSSLEYHKFLENLIDRFDADSARSEIIAFLGGIKVFDPKNLDK